MTDLLAALVWPFAMVVFALLFGAFMYWRINKQHPIEPPAHKKPNHTMAE